MSELRNSREKIDEIDRQLSCLFEERMGLTDSIGLYKAEKGLPVYDPVREREKIEHIKREVRDPDKAEDVAALFSKVMEISRQREERIIEKKHC